MPKLLTVAEVARLLRVDPSTVQRRIHRREIKAIKLAGRTGAWVIDERDIPAPSLFEADK